MAQATEIAQLYYTLGARTDASTASVLSSQGTALDDLSQSAQAAGVPLGALQAAVAQLVDEVEGDLQVALRQMSGGLEEASAWAQALSASTAAIGDATEESMTAVSASVALYAAATRQSETRQQSLQQLTAIEQQLKVRLQDGNLSLEQRIRLERVLAQTQVTLVGAMGRSSGAIVATERTARAAGTAVKELGSKWSSTALNVVTAASSIVQSGSVSSGGLKAVLTGATSLAGFLGAGGALVVAAAVAANAIIGVFTQAREEAKKAKEEISKQLDELQDRGDAEGLAAQARKLQSGVIKDGVRSDGLVQAKAEVAAAEAALESVRGRSLTVQENAERKLAAAEAKVAALNADIAEIAKRAQAVDDATPPKTPTRVTATSPTGDAEAAKKRAEAAKQQAAAFQNLRDAVDDLVGAVSASDSVLAAFDRKLREIEQAFTALKNPTKDQIAEFARMQVAAAGARASLANLEADKAAQELRKIEASLTPSLLDDMAQSTRELAEQLRRLNAPPDVIARVLGLKRAIDDATLAGDALDKQLRAIATSGAGSFSQIVALGEIRRSKEAELFAIVGDSEEAARRRLDLQSQIATVQAAEATLAGQQNIAEAKSVDSAERLLDLVQDTSSAALGIATAFLGAESSITRMIGGVAQVASGFARIAESAKAAGGFGALFSSGAGLASALPGLGAIIGGLGAISSLTRRRDPAEEQRLKVLQENTQRLAELRDRIGDVVLSASGRDVAAIRNAVTTGTRVIGRDQQTDEDIIAEFDLPINAILADLRRAGVSLEDLRKVAADFGITLSESPTVEQLRQLQEAIRKFSLSQLLDTLDGELRRLELKARIDPATFGGLNGIVEKVKIFAGPNGVPAIAAALEGLDLTSAAGRADAITRLRALFDNIADLDLGALGDLSPDTFLDALVELITGLQDAQPTVRTAAERFADALEAWELAVERGTLTAAERLAKAQALFVELFPDLLDSVDFSSADAFTASIQSLIDGFAADGELSEAERTQIDILRALAQAFADAADPAEVFIDALTALSDRFELFATSAVDQVAAILAEVTSDASIGKNAGFAILKGLTDGLDLATQAGNNELRKRAQAIYDQLAEGGITEDEQAIVEILKRVLGLSADAAAAAAQTAEGLAAAAKRALEESRAAIFALADAFLAVHDITDPVEILRVRAAALAKAFPELADTLGGFDLATQEGRDALEEWIRSLIGAPDALTAMAESLGITVDELIQQLLGLESAADDAATQVATLADTLAAAFDEVNFGINLEGITDPIERLKRTVAGIGGLIPEIDAALAGLDLNSASGRAQAEAQLIALGKSTTNAAVRDAVLKLLAQIRGVPTPIAGAADPGRAGSDLNTGDVRFSAFATATVGQVDTMLTLLTRIRENTQVMADAFLRGPGGVRAPILPALPQLVASATAGGGGVVFNVSATINVYPGVSPETARVALDEGGDRIRRQIEDIVETGGAQRLVRSQRSRGVPLQT